MKRFTGALLSVCLLAALCFPAAAFAPAADTALTPLTDLPEGSDLISVGLPGSRVYSNPTGAALTAEQKADVADIGYGISLIGVEKNLARPVTAVSDGVWSNFNAGGETLENTMNEKGACKFLTSPDTYYNVTGETGKEDSRYIFLLTYNFGKVMELDAIGFYAQNANAILRAADIYISNNGTDWTLVGMYDGNQLRVEGRELVSSGKSPADALAGSVNFSYLWSLEGHSARYVRVAAVKGLGVNASESYDGFSADPATGSGVDFRELVIYGKDPNPEIRPYYGYEDTGAVYRGVQESAVREGLYSLRFIGTTESRDVSGLGFRITADCAEGRRCYDTACTCVYRTLLADAGQGMTKQYTAAELGGSYLYALTLRGIPVSAGEITFRITPYVLEDGVEKTGASYIVVYRAGEFVSQTVEEAKGGI